MKLTQEKIQELKTRLIDHWYDGINSIEDFEELIDIFESNGLIDNEDDDEENNNEC